jgi:3'-phosphoadenosine 5'-phosphosulfate sulfotransferase (PAPS reductase)/FAD synthetase
MRAADANPYRLPPGAVQICFSGGRTSAYMLRKILDENGPLPDRALVLFQNTGREMDETLHFVQETGLRFGVPITWVEYRPRVDLQDWQLSLVAENMGERFARQLRDWWTPDPRGFAEVSHNSAARHGEPLTALVMARKFLPNQAARFCTQELKIRTAKRYLVAKGWTYWTNAIGIRADEAHRSATQPKERFSTWRPLVAAGVSKRDVEAFWNRQAFDLRLPNVKGNCWLGNCDGCFLKSEANVAAFTRDFPDRADWWEGMERLATALTTGRGATWSKRYSRKDLRLTLERQGDAVFSVEGFFCQKDDGECTG